jgi:hypothetical protein
MRTDELKWRFNGHILQWVFKKMPPRENERQKSRGEVKNKQNAAAERVNHLPPNDIYRVPGLEVYKNKCLCFST